VKSGLLRLIGRLTCIHVLHGREEGIRWGALVQVKCRGCGKVDLYVDSRR
jgi:hypothetical protein